MFLANLENQYKISFLNLAQTLISADGVLSEAETAMMTQYQQEMSLAVTSATEQQTVENSVKAFGSASLSIKKQVMFELVALACADNDFAGQEQKLLRDIGGAWGLDTAFLEKSYEYVQELTSLYSRISRLVSE